jgi:glycosyltransferase involved in cell wall biosynthesis
MGVAATLNRGLDLATGEYIARMDADDISLPERLAKQVAYLDANEEIAVLGTNVESFNELGTISTGWSALNPEQMKVDLLFACGLAHPSVMMRAEVIRELGGYDVEFNGLEDYELWCRVLENHKITTLPDILLRYRIHGSQVTQNPSQRYLALLRALKTRQIQQLGLEPAEEFLRYCECGKLDDPEKLRALDEFFSQVDVANSEKHIYDAEKLRASFRSVIMASATKLQKTKQKELAANCHYINKHDLFVRQLKQSIKNILGRN